MNLSYRHAISQREKNSSEIIKYRDKRQRWMAKSQSKHLHPSDQQNDKSIQNNNSNSLLPRQK